MLTYAALSMFVKTIIVTLLFLTMVAGICTCLLVGKKQGRVKLILLPTSIKSKRCSMKMSRLTPQVQAIQKRYADDQQRQRQQRRLFGEDVFLTRCQLLIQPLQIFLYPQNIFSGMLPVQQLTE